MQSRATLKSVFLAEIEADLAGRGLRDRLAQRYIERPLLLWGQRKFDLRVWVLVRSFSPLQVYLYSEVYVRLCTESYDPKDLCNKFRHISNWSLNRLKAGWRVGLQTRASSEPAGAPRGHPQDCAATGERASHVGPPKAPAQEDAQLQGASLAGETTLPLQYLRVALAEKTGKEDFWDEILLPQLRYMVVQTMRAARHSVVQRSNCFELFGLDVLLDEKLRPWLLEVNLSPACSSRQPWLRCLLKRMTKQLLDIVLSMPRGRPASPEHTHSPNTNRSGGGNTAVEATTAESVQIHAASEIYQGGHWELVFDESLPLERALAILPPIAAPTREGHNALLQKPKESPSSRLLIEELYAAGVPVSDASGSHRYAPRIRGLSVQGRRITSSGHRIGGQQPLRRKHEAPGSVLA